jgi:hypothetical protein
MRAIWFTSHVARNVNGPTQRNEEDALTRAIITLADRYWPFRVIES